MKKLTGNSVSTGIAIGSAFLHMQRDLPDIPRSKVSESRIESEFMRYINAAKEAADEIRNLIEKAKHEKNKEQEDILFAHLMMLEDDDFHDQIRASLTETSENIEWVFFDVSRDLMQKMHSSADQLLRERAADIKDISVRIMNKLLPDSEPALAALDHDVIVVADDILPSEMLTMNRTHVKGIAMDTGGATSHTAILARSFNIPAVMGLSIATNEIHSGDTLVLDALAGEVHINPGAKELERWELIKTGHIKKTSELLKNRDLPAETKDGHRVLLKANIELPEEAGEVSQYGAEGIGLYRSEFLFLNPHEDDGEENQYQSYSRVIKAMNGLPVTIRTIDLGGDKILPDSSGASEKNPLLGWRAIRFSLARPDFFKAQLRAILRAGVHGNVKIMFPMISGIEELGEALNLLEEAKSECRNNKQPIADDIETGIMIEVPSAAMTAGILAEKAGFFSIGTNDLVQYTLAVDRGNEKVSYLAQPLHPAVLRLIKNTIDAAHGKGIRTAMCGEMAGDPNMTALLLGLGLDEFSMTASAIPQVKQIIMETNISLCRELAAEILKGTSSSANKDTLMAWMAAHFPSHKAAE